MRDIKRAAAQEYCILYQLPTAPAESFAHHSNPLCTTSPSQTFANLEAGIVSCNRCVQCAIHGGFTVSVGSSASCFLSKLAWISAQAYSLLTMACREHGMMSSFSLLGSHARCGSEKQTYRSFQFLVSWPLLQHQ